MDPELEAAARAAGVGRGKRHVFLCADRENPKCSDADRALEMLRGQADVLVEIDQAMTRAPGVGFVASGVGSGGAFRLDDPLETQQHRHKQAG